MEDDLGLLVATFRKSLQARKRSPKTISAYARSTRPRSPEPRSRTSSSTSSSSGPPPPPPPGSGASSSGSKYLLEEQVIERSPMANMSPPSLGETPVPVLSTDELSAMITTADHPGFEGRRDAAMVRMFIDTGARLGEMVSMTTESLDFDGQEVLVVGKGDRARYLPFGDKTALAVGRYLRERAKHRLAHDPALWLGIRGPLTDSGITQRLRKIADAAGVEGFHPHRFRHTFAHRWLAAGGNEGDLQTLAGWRTPQMVARYGASAKAERARDAHRKLALGDDL